MYLEVQGTTNPTVTIAKPATLASNKWDVSSREFIDMLENHAQGSCKHINNLY